MKRIWLVLSLALLLMAACAFVVPEASPESEMTAEETGAGEEKVLTILYWQAPSLPGPYLAGGGKDLDAGAITLEPLANVDPDGNPVPKLAAAIPTLANGGLAEDGRSVTWILKEGVKWSDGSAFTAEDVVFTWEYCTHPESACEGPFGGVSNVEALDAHTVRVSFDAFTPYPYNAFVTGSGPILQRAQFAACVGAAAWSCNEQNTLPHGTGPYRIVDFRVNDVALYERNEHYRGAPAYFDRVVLKGGGDAASAARAVLETGKAHYAWNLQVEPHILAAMEAGGRGEIISASGGRVERILVNQTNPDARLDSGTRSVYMGGANAHPFLVGTPIAWALSMAIDRGALAGQLYGFAGRPTCNIIPGPSRYVSTANDGCLVQDIKGARALLDGAGILDTDGDGVREYRGLPLVVRYQTTTNTVRQKTQALIKQWWAAIGIGTELLDHNAGVFFGGDPNSPDTYVKFYADVQMYSMEPGIDPQDHLSAWQCRAIPTPDDGWAGSNSVRGCDPAFDALFAELVQTPMGPARERIVKALNDMHVQKGFQIPLVHRRNVSARAHALQHVHINSWDTELWNIADWALAEE